MDSVLIILALAALLIAWAIVRLIEHIIFAPNLQWNGVMNIARVLVVTALVASPTGIKPIDLEFISETDLIAPKNDRVSQSFTPPKPCLLLSLGRAC